MTDVLERIIENLNVYDIYGEGASDIKPSQGGYVMKCPFPDHADTKPSFRVKEENLSFRCFGCGRHGSAFDYIMQMQEVEFPEAKKILADRAGIDLKTGGSRYQRLYDINREAQKFYVDNLSRSPEITDYLLNVRKLSPETIKRWGIGCTNGKQVVHHLRGLGYSAEEIVQSGLACRDTGSLTDLFFGRRIMIPIPHTMGGNIVGFGGRLVGTPEETIGAPKYLNSYDSPIFHKKKLLFGFRPSTVDEKGSLTIVEGFLDVIACHEKGYANTAAPLGTALTREHIALIRKKCGNIPVLPLFDGDDAGFRAAKRAVQLLFASYMTGQVALLPAGEDPDSYLRAGQDLEGLFANATPLSVFLVKHFPEKRQYVFNELLKRRNTLAMAEHVAWMGSPAEQEAVREVSVRLLIEQRLKTQPVIARSNGAEVRRYAEDLYLVDSTTGKILLCEGLTGKADCKDRAYKMLMRISALQTKKKR